MHRTLSRRLTDARRLTHHRRRTPTFPSHLPLLRIDHVFVSHGIRVLQLDAPFTVQTRMASDHLPLVMAFELQ